MVGVRSFLSKRGYFDCDSMAAHQHHAERGAHGVGSREDVHDIFRVRARGDVVVLGLESEQFIPDAPSRKPGDMSG